MVFKSAKGINYRASGTTLSCVWFVLLAMLANLAMPLAAQGAAAWTSSEGARLVAICTAQGIRLVPLAELAPEVTLTHESDPARPSSGSGFGHCDACLGGLVSLAAGAIGSDWWPSIQWRSPQVATCPDDPGPRALAYRAEARGPPAFA